MDKEIDLLLNLFIKPSVKDGKDYHYWQGKIGAHDIYLSKCGIGKVNSALHTLKMIQEVNPDLVINSGVAGGAGVAIGTVMVASAVAYHDVWCGPGTNYGQADGVPLLMKPSREILNIAVKENLTQGLICSGDKFISTPEEIKFIRGKFPKVKAVDMESASIAQTCMLCGTPFAVVRIVSDTPGEGENISQYKDFWANAPHKTFSVIEKILTSI